MSLRIFHIVFVTICTLLALFIAWWEYDNYRAFDGLHWLGAMVSALFAVVMIVYGVWFWKKAKRLIL